MEQYEVREKHFQSALQSKQLELQLSATKLYEQKHLVDETNMKLRQTKLQLEAAVQNESQMREQLSAYAQQFRRVEETLQRNNELFVKFRAELEEV
jgi:hypothetical protein